LIYRITKSGERGRALGVHIIGGSASNFLAPLLIGGIAAAWSWRGSFIALAIPTLALGPVLFFLLSRAHGFRSEALEDGGSEREGDRSARFWLRMVSFLVLTTFGGALVGSITGFIPLLMVDSYRLKEQAAAGLLAITYSAGLWMAPLAGWLSDRLGKLPLLFAGCLVAAPSIFFLPRVGHGVALYIVLLLIGSFIFVRMPVSEAFLMGEAPSRMRATLLGVYFLGSSVGGGVFTPALGHLADDYGFRRSFDLAAGSLLAVTAVCAALLWASGGLGSRKRTPRPRIGDPD
jgi:MFS family permease